MVADTYTDWVLVSLSPLSTKWQIGTGLLVLLATLAVITSYRNSRHRWPMLGIRVLGALLVIGFLTEPALQTRIVRKIRNRLAIVIDQSKSMTLPGLNGQSREAAVQSFLRSSKSNLKKLADSHILEFYNLDGLTSEAQLNQVSEGEETDLLTAVLNVQRTNTSQPLAGVVLISDGADLAHLQHDSEPESPGVRRELAKLNVPINTARASESDQFKDISISRVSNDEFSFVHNTMEIQVEVVSTGLGQINLPLSLKRDGELLSTEEVVLKPNQSTMLTLKTKPDKIGRFIYTVSLPAISGEAVEKNNSNSFALKVIRDKIRVLHVAGRPSWDERFLRQHLKENPNVDLISFFILRTPTDSINAPDKEMSLIPFPVNKIFDTELHTFDIIILQNFDYRPYSMERFLPNIRKAVENGLGFVMLGGTQSFGDGGYQGTAIDSILPVRINLGGTASTTQSLQLTAAGQNHPITQLLRTTQLNQAQWETLPPWQTINQTGGTVPDGTSLVVSSELRDPTGAPLPLVSVREIKDGRSLAIASDSMWRWRFNDTRDGGAAERAYHRFWSNALRWLVRDPTHSRIQVLPSKSRYQQGEVVSVKFRVVGHDYNPLVGAHLQVTLEQPETGQMEIRDILTDEAGTAQIQYDSPKPGAYRVIAASPGAGDSLGRGQGVLIVEAQSPELAYGSPRPMLLNRLAEATKGYSGKLDSNFWNQLKVVDPEVIEIDRRRNTELWDNGWALLLGLILFTLDWTLRRRNGYL